MKAGVVLIAFLLSTGIYMTEGIPSVQCRCIDTVDYMLPNLVIHCKRYPPRVYCSKEEVIVMSKKGKSVCLTPNGRFVTGLNNGQIKIKCG